jgi:hypothetical protein
MIVNVTVPSAAQRVTKRIKDGTERRLRADNRRLTRSMPTRWADRPPHG